MFLARDIGAAAGPTSDFWYAPISSISTSGARVNADSALRLSTVYKCVRVRSETIGMLPLVVYRRSSDGRAAAADHPLYSLLHDRPNPWQTSMMWRQMMQAHLDLRGNAYSQIVFDGAGRVDMLVPLDPDAMRVEVLPSGQPRYRYRKADGKEAVLVAGEVLHVALFALDGYVGMSPIELQREAIGSAISSRDYGAAYFGNSARPPAWIEMPGKFASSEDRREWVSAFSSEYGRGNSGKTPVLERGLKLHPIAVSNADAQYLESRKFSDTDIAGIYRMPPHKIGNLERSTWGNIEHQQIDFVTDTIMPSCVAWEQALLRDLDFGDDAFPEFKLQGLLRGDTRTRYESYGKAIRDGWLTRNEARQLENLNALDGLDAPLEPLNMKPAGSTDDSEADDAADVAEGDAEDQSEGDGETADARQAAQVAQQSAQRRLAIAQAAAERVARKEYAVVSRAYRPAADMAAVEQALASGHAEFVAQVMAVPQAAASRHVRDTLDHLRQAHAAGTLGRVTETDFIAAQASALLRLED